MENTPIRQIETSEASVYAFEISGELSEIDHESMAATMNCAFEAHEEVNMLLLFRQFEGSDTGASLNPDALKCHWKSTNNVNRYAVVNAPDEADALIGIVESVIPVDAQTFNAADTDDAWSFVGAHPV